MLKIYMAVTPDKYELPLYVADNTRELANVFNTSDGNVKSCISKGKSGTTNGYKFIRVEVEE